LGAKKRVLVTLDVHGETAEVAIALPKGRPMRIRGRIRIDETTSPKSWDWVGFRTGDGEEFPEVLAIYRIDGEERITLVTGGLTGGRPQTFEAGEGILAEVITFTRRLRPERPESIAER